MKKNTMSRQFILLLMCLFLTGMTVASSYAAEAPGSYNGKGPYRTASYLMPGSYVTIPATATVYYPTNGEPPYPGIVFCPPYLTTQIGFAAWGPWFASHGFVLVTMDTTTIMDQVTARDNQQWRVVQALIKENSRAASRLNGQLDTSKIGIMGWSMGGGATWINASKHGGEIKTAMTLAGHNLTAWYNTDLYTSMSPAEMNEYMNAHGKNINIPTLMFNGATDTTILGGMGQSDGVYNNIRAGVPKILCVMATKGHFAWSSPNSGGTGVAALALAFEKTFLDGDESWMPYIQRPMGVSKWQTSGF